MTFQCSRRKGFKLCVINEATTAFATFKFTPQFFETYRVGQDTNNHDDDNEDNEDDDLMMDDDDDEKDDDDNNTGHGQVTFASLLKPIANVLRTTNRGVEKLSILYEKMDEEYGMSTANLILQLVCQHGIVKTHTFQVESTELIEGNKWAIVIYPCLSPCSVASHRASSFFCLHQPNSRATTTAPTVFPCGPCCCKDCWIAFTVRVKSP